MNCKYCHKGKYIGLEIIFTSKKKIGGPGPGGPPKSAPDCCDLCSSVCMCVCVCAHACVCVHGCMRTCVCLCVCARACVCDLYLCCSFTLFCNNIIILSYALI